MSGLIVPAHVRADIHARRGKPEYAEQSGVVKLYQSIGASVYVNSVYGAHPKGVTPGIPDMRVKQPDWRLEWDHETKPAKGRQSKAQYDYLRECQAMGTVYVLGGISEALDFLDFLGIVEKRLADTAQFKPRDEWAGMVAEWGPLRGAVAVDWYASREWAAMFDRYGYKT